MQKTLANRKAQVMGMPFMIIFSIIIIALTIYAGIVLIKGFIETSDKAKIATFYNDFKNDVNSLWQATSASKSYSYDLPSGIEKVCFMQPSKPLSNESKNLSDLYNQFRNLPNAKTNNHNMFLAPTKIAVGLQVPASFRIDCGQTQKVDCLDITNLPNPYCISVDKGTLKIDLLKEGKIVQIVKK